jgi:hypothetical protein
MQIFARKTDKVESIGETPLGTVQISETPHDMYYVILKPAGSEGSVLGAVSFAREKLKDLRKGAGETYELLKDRLKLSDGNRIIQVEGCFPFMNVPDEKMEQLNLGRKGVGIAVLANLIDKWRLKGFAAVYCYTEDVAMQGLLDKLGFEKEGVRYFKELRSKID